METLNHMSGGDFRAAITLQKPKMTLNAEEMSILFGRLDLYTMFDYKESINVLQNDKDLSSALRILDSVSILSDIKPLLENTADDSWQIVLRYNQEKNLKNILQSENIPNGFLQICDKSKHSHKLKLQSIITVLSKATTLYRNKVNEFLLLSELVIHDTREHKELTTAELDTLKVLREINSKEIVQPMRVSVNIEPPEQPKISKSKRPSLPGSKTKLSSLSKNLSKCKIIAGKFVVQIGISMNSKGKMKVNPFEFQSISEELLGTKWKYPVSARSWLGITDGKPHSFDDYRVLV